MRKTEPVNESSAPQPHSTSAGRILVRAAEPDDAPRVARLLTLRGASVDEALQQAPRMIDTLPVLLLALMSAAGEHRTATAGESPAGRDGGHASNASHASNGGHGGDLGEDSNDRHDDRHTDRHADGADGADGADDSDTDDALLAPVALSGAFPLPERMRASLPEPDSGSEDAWMVSGLVIDPVARRGGVGRVLLTAVAEAVNALRPAADLYSVVNATNHASVGLHLLVGFERLARLGGFGAVTFEDGQGVLLRRAG